MDFLKTIMNEISGDNSSEVGNLAKALLSNSGDKGVLLDTVVNTIKEKGMEDSVESWIGTGDNKAISANQLNDALGSDLMSTLSEKTGIPEKELGGMLSTLLPVVVNQLTPKGKTEGDNGSLVSTGLGLLKGFL
jgi:uncharacterized protein YidB (DUF937 family)